MRRFTSGYWTLLVYLIVGGVVGAAIPPTAQAQQTAAITQIERLEAHRVPDPADICVLDPLDVNADTHVRRVHPEAEKAAKTATIEVNYTGFTPEARAAFERAVDIWEQHISSDVTIKVDASFESLGAGVLGSAGPQFVWRATDENGQQSLFADALVDALLGENAVLTDDDPENDDAPDITAFFSSDTNWYFGEAPPDGSGPSPNEVDFTSVVLHELAHGLGFFGSMSVSGDGQGSWGFGTLPGTPVIYDRFPIDGGGIPLIDTGTYSNPSNSLGDALTSSNVFFEGEQTNVGAINETGPVPPKLYLPPQWQQGSSYSHLDEFTYPVGDLNSLMTPRIGRNELIHTPGPVTCGMFADMGWTLGAGCEAFIQIEIVGFEVASNDDNELALRWAEAANANIDRYVIEGRYAEGSFEPIGTMVTSRGPDDYEVIISRDELRRLIGISPGLPVAGDYAFRLRLVRPSGVEVASDEVQTTIQVDATYAVSSIYPNPFVDEAQLSLTLRSGQSVRVEVYNSLGQQVAVIYDERHPANDPRPITFDASRFRNLPSGLYFFRIMGRNFTETKKAMRVR